MNEKTTIAAQDRHGFAQASYSGQHTATSMHPELPPSLTSRALKSKDTLNVKSNFGHDFSQVQVHIPQRVQTNLTSNLPVDKYEQEADQIAEKLMRIPSSAMQPVPICKGSLSDCYEKVPYSKTLQKSVADSGTPLSPEKSRIIPSGGRPLDQETRSFFELSFGLDFNEVRVHTGSQAARLTRALQAKAYTLGHDIVFGEGQHQPKTTTGRQLLAHELAHVVQQQSQTPCHLQRQSIYNPLFPCHITSRLPGGLDFFGTLVHLAIQQHYVSEIDPLAATEYVIPGSGPSGQSGRADIVSSNGGIYEIKPQGLAQEGYEEALTYLTSAEIYCDPHINWHLGLTYWAPPMVIGGNRVISWLLGPGLIVYQRVRQREREPVPAREREREPSTEHAPESNWERVAEWARRVYEEGLDATEAAEDFLRENPELIGVIIGAGAIAIVALIVDDATIVGIADDVLIPIIGALEWVALRLAFVGI
jgi:hypothetical protein